MGGEVYVNNNDMLLSKDDEFIFRFINNFFFF